MPDLLPPSPRIRRAPRREAWWLDVITLAAGLAFSMFCIRLVLATSRINWRLDWDLGAMIALLLLPLGPALTTTPLLPWRFSPRTWTLGQWLWPGVALTSLAWLEVWLDAGIYLGPLAKLICGPTALLLTPVLGLAALSGLLYSLRRPAAYRLSHWLGLICALTSAAGCVWFVAIMLKIRF